MPQVINQEIEDTYQDIGDAYKQRRKCEANGAHLYAHKWRAWEAYFRAKLDRQYAGEFIPCWDDPHYKAKTVASYYANKLPYKM